MVSWGSVSGKVPWMLRCCPGLQNGVQAWQAWVEGGRYFIPGQIQVRLFSFLNPGAIFSLVKSRWDWIFLKHSIHWPPSSPCRCHNVWISSAFVHFLTFSSGMSEDEVREEFSKFLEQHHDGKIHKREFKKMLEQVFIFLPDCITQGFHNITNDCSDVAWPRRHLYAEAHLPVLRREREWLHRLCWVYGETTIMYNEKTKKKPIFFSWSSTSCLTALQKRLCEGFSASSTSTGTGRSLRRSWRGSSRTCSSWSRRRLLRR